MPKTRSASWRRPSCVWPEDAAVEPVSMDVLLPEGARLIPGNTCIVATYRNVPAENNIPKPVASTSASASMFCWRW